MDTERSPRGRRRAAYAILAALALGACATTGAADDTPYATVVVENDNTSTVNVYAMRGGSRFRLGTVTGLATVEFDLRRHMLGSGGVLQLLIDPIGSRRNYPAQTIVVDEGDIIELRVSSFLR